MLNLNAHPKTHVDSKNDADQCVLSNNSLSGN